MSSNVNRQHDKALARELLNAKLLTMDQVRECVALGKEDDQERSLEEVILEKSLLSPEDLAKAKSKLGVANTMVDTGSNQPASPTDENEETEPGGDGGGAANSLTPSLIESAMTQSNSSGAGTGSGVQLAPGTVLKGDYKIVKLLGQGGMGAVYLAEQESLQRKVAVKIISGAIAGSPEFVERFRREAQSAAQLSHTNIIQVYGVGEEGDLSFLVMEFVDGTSLMEMIRERGKLPVDEALDLITQSLEGLGKAHEKGILHRDIKPDNIFVDQQGNAKLGDFGIAKNIHQSSLTQTGTVMGTPHYMSPEQAEGKELDFRADLYSMGATLYHAVAGEPPYAGDSPMTIMYKQINEPLSFPKEIRDLMPIGLKKLVQKMMAKEKWRRHSSAEELVGEIKKVRSGLTQEGSSSQEGGWLPGGAGAADAAAAVSSPASSSKGPVAYTVSGDSEIKKPSLKGVAMGAALGWVIIFGVVVGDLFSWVSSGEVEAETVPVATGGDSTPQGKTDYSDIIKDDGKSKGPKVPFSVLSQIAKNKKKGDHTKALSIIDENLKKFPKSKELIRQKEIVAAKMKETKAKREEIEILLKRSAQLELKGKYLSAIRAMNSAFEKSHGLPYKLKIEKALKALYGTAMRSAVKSGNVDALMIYSGDLQSLGVRYGNWLAPVLEQRRKMMAKALEARFRYYKSQLASSSEGSDSSGSGDKDAAQKELDAAQKRYDFLTEKITNLNREYSEESRELYNRNLSQGGRQSVRYKLKKIRDNLSKLGIEKRELSRKMYKLRRKANRSRYQSSSNSSSNSYQVRKKMRSAMYKIINDEISRAQGWRMKMGLSFRDDGYKVIKNYRSDLYKLRGKISDYTSQIR